MEKIEIPLEVFKQKLPNVTDDTLLMECTENCCYLPFGQGKIILSTKFLHEIDNKLYVVNTARVMNYLAYFIEEA